MHVPLYSLVTGAAPSLQTPPDPVPQEMPALHELAVDDSGKPLVSKTEWEQQRLKLKQKWRSVLGDFPTNKTALSAEIISTEKLEDFKRSFVRYLVEEGVHADGYLLVPNGASRKSAAVVVFHPTTPSQAKGVAGVDPSYEQDKQQGIQLVKRGFVVWCPRNYINQDGADWADNARRVMAVHPSWTGMTRMVWDAIRAVDFLETLPEVDKNRIGCIGHSLGAKVVIYSMAFDERYKAGVFSEGGIGLRFSNWEAPWYLGPKIHAPDFELDNDSVLALIAPRAFLLLAGDSADDDRSWAFIKGVQPIYTLLGSPRNLGWWNHHGGHRYPPEARQIAEVFLDTHLKKEKAK